MHFLLLSILPNSPCWDPSPTGGLLERTDCTHQRGNNHPDLSVDDCGLFVSAENNWLAASPDGIVHDSSEIAHPLGTLEIKNPYSFRDNNLVEACSKSSFCLEEDKINKKFRLKQQHSYYFQVQCQIYCANTQWCDFVVRTNRDLHIERIYRDEEWWNGQLGKLEKFYFDALLPKLASPRFSCGGIREPAWLPLLLLFHSFDVIIHLFIILPLIQSSIYHHFIYSIT